MGLYTHVTRADGTVLTGEGSISNIFNVDHVNHVTHTAAPFINSFEDDIPQMQLETDPAPLGIVSLSEALSDELRRLRFAMHQVKRNINASTAPAHWYTPVNAGDALVMAAQAARLEANQAQNIASNLLTLVGFQSVVYEHGQLVVLEVGGFTGLRAPVDGVYIVGATMGFGNALVANDFHITLTLDNLRIGTDQYDNRTDSSAAAKALTVETVVKLSAGQIMRVMVFQNSGTVQSLATDATFRPAFWMSLIGRAINTF